MSEKPMSFPVTLKAAITLDGKIATVGRDSKWITGEAARMEAHRLRHQHDAILVGIRTVLSDDPELNVRGIPGGQSPVRIILDSRGRLPPKSKVLTDDSIRVIQVLGSDKSGPETLIHKNLTRIRAKTLRPEIPWIIDQLKRQGIGSLLVEGGSEVHASFIRCGFVSRLHLFVAPKLIGGSKALSWCGDLGVNFLYDAVKWKILSITPAGLDWHLVAEPQGKAEA